MCGIYAYIKLGVPKGDDRNAIRKTVQNALRKLQHRGPDWSGTEEVGNTSCKILGHRRLSIVDPDGQAQPLVWHEHHDKVLSNGESMSMTLIANGEIYNHCELRDKIDSGTEPPFRYTTRSDCEVIIPVLSYDDGSQSYVPQVANALNQLDGDFSFLVHNKVASFHDSSTQMSVAMTGNKYRERYIAARDCVGVTPLYYAVGKDRVEFASEMKAIENLESVRVFPPGHYAVTNGSADCFYFKLCPFYDHSQKWKLDPEKVIHDRSVIVDTIREKLFTAVRKRMMCDVPYGVLLSGGLDSSIIASIVCRLAKEKDPSAVVHTFSIGLEGSPDLQYARLMAEYLGTKHHEFTYTSKEGIEAVPDVVYHLETYDPTTIRAGTPMYLLARSIRSLGVKMVLSGEGADELFGGYLYFGKAPNEEEFIAESYEKVTRLHEYDCLRANKATQAFSVEARVPFLDKDFIEFVFQCILTAHKMWGGDTDKQEKHLLRDAFADMLPPEIALRQKEQFSDGVGYSWIDDFKKHCGSHVSDIEERCAEMQYVINPPRTKEGIYIRQIFDSHFNTPAAALTVPNDRSMACSTERALAWEEGWQKSQDPSGRAVSVHTSSTVSVGGGVETGDGMMVE